MSSVSPLTVRNLVPTDKGFAVFLSSPAKLFVIYIDSQMAPALDDAMKKIVRERPVTHQLIGSIFLGLGVQLDHVVLTDVSNNVFYARLILRMENELGKKILELDARPSDSLVLALRAGRPVYATEELLEKVEDMSDVLEKILRDQASGDDSDL